MSESSDIVTGLARIGMVLRQDGWRRADAAGLPPTQAQILVHLSARGPARAGELAQQIAVSQPTASDAVAALVRKGHLERSPHAKDGRASRLSATEKGRRTAGTLAVWPDALLGA